MRSHGDDDEAATAETAAATAEGEAESAVDWLSLCGRVAVSCGSLAVLALFERA